MKTAQKIDIFVPTDPQIALRRIRSLIQKIVHETERPESGILGVIFVDHEMSQTINRQFLAHDYPTDVIAFEYDDSEDEKWGELYINVQKAREQAVEYGVSYENELARLIIHGILHLDGYDDQDDASRVRMKRREDDLVESYASIFTSSAKA